MNKLNIINICLFMTVLLFSCKDEKREELERTVAEWVGKKLLIPDSLATVSGSIPAMPEKDYTIIAYYDSTGCTGCRMKLRHWEDFMREIDSVKQDKKVGLTIIAASNDIKELELLVKQNAFRYSMHIDKADLFKNANKLLEDHKLQCFLVDRGYNILAMGNPVDNKAIARLYLRIIGETNAASSSETVYSHDFGTIYQNQTVSHVFRLSNENTDTLQVNELITSCECTEATISEQTIAPGKEYEVRATFHDTIPGKFERTITLSFNDNKTGISFELSGVIVNNNQKNEKEDL